MNDTGPVYGWTGVELELLPWRNMERMRTCVFCFFGSFLLLIEMVCAAAIFYLFISIRLKNLNFAFARLR